MDREADTRQPKSKFRPPTEVGISDIIKNPILGSSSSNSSLNSQQLRNKHASSQDSASGSFIQYKDSSSANPKPSDTVSRIKKETAPDPPRQLEAIEEEKTVPEKSKSSLVQSEADREQLKRIKPTSTPRDLDDLAKPNLQKPKKRPPAQIQRQNSKPRTKSEGRQSKSKTIVPISELEDRFEIGKNIPQSVFRKLTAEILKKEAEYRQNSWRMEKTAFLYLNIFAENFLVEKFERAMHIVRARGRKTLSKIDLQTLEFIEEDYFTRRKSCPLHLRLADLV